MKKKKVIGRRVFSDNKYVKLKIYDNLSQETLFESSALLSDKKAVIRLFDDAEAKGLFDRR